MGKVRNFLDKNPLVKLLAINCLSGLAAASILSVVVFATDTGHLRSLVMSSDEPLVPLLLLFFGFVVTMCSVMMGTAVMWLDDSDDDGEGPGGRRFKTVRVRNRDRR